MATPTPKTKKPATKRALPIAEIRNDTVVMRDGTLRAVLMVSSINFALKSNEEQEAIIGSYMQFLNSFTFPFQIVVQSRSFSIDTYLAKLERAEKQQVNDLLKMQISNYRAFVGELVNMGSIMSKRFYLVVPYDPASDKQKGFLARLGDIFAPTAVVRLQENRFRERLHQLEQRVGHVSSGLDSMGLRSERLNTEQLIELYYNSYNPETAAQEKLTDVTQARIEPS